MLGDDRQPIASNTAISVLAEFLSIVAIVTHVEGGMCTFCYRVGDISPYIAITGEHS